jgi:predicted MFS family arabinose efflux permease
MLLNVGNSMFLAQFYIFTYNQLKFSYEAASIVVALGAVGALIGAVLAQALFKRIGLGPSLVLALGINGVGELAIPNSLSGPAALVFPLLWLFASIGLPIYNINQVSFRQAIIPNELQGRMNATMRTFGYGAFVVGALMGGILASKYGIIPIMIVGALIALIPIPTFRLERIGRANSST